METEEAARESKRICTTIRITDTGIRPGNGVGNHRIGLNRETLGVPVIAAGVPMVVYASVIARDALTLLVRENGEAEEAHEAAMDALISCTVNSETAMRPAPFGRAQRAGAVRLPGRFAEERALSPARRHARYAHRGGKQQKHAGGSAERRAAAHERHFQLFRSCGIELRGGQKYAILNAGKIAQRRLFYEFSPYRNV